VQDQFYQDDWHTMDKKSQVIGDKYLPSTHADYGTPPSLYPIIWGDFNRQNEALKLSQVPNLGSEYDYLVGEYKKSLKEHGLTLLDRWNETKSLDFLDDLPPPVKKQQKTGPHSDIASGVSSFLAWRRDHGLNFLDMVKLSKIPSKRLAQIEHGQLQASFSDITRLCRAFGLHPVEVIDFESRLSEGEIDLAVDALTKPYRYKGSQYLTDDLRDALDEWIENDVSYDVLEDFWKELDESDPENKALNEFLNMLLINDGNPNLHAYGVCRLSVVTMGGLQRSSEVFKEKAEMALRQMDQLIVPIDLFGRTHQGPYWWPAYRESLLLMLRQCGDNSKGFKTVKDFFFDTAIIAKPTNRQKEALANFVDMVNGLCDQEDIHDTNEELYCSYELQEDALGDFLTKYEGILRNYEVRQAILSRTNIGMEFGNPDDKDYLTKSDVIKWTEVLPAKVKLLPRPSL
jgi:transcriptional regulator with XRE-family HTH domain